MSYNIALNSKMALHVFVCSCNKGETVLDRLPRLQDNLPMDWFYAYAAPVKVLPSGGVLTWVRVLDEARLGEVKQGIGADLPMVPSATGVVEVPRLLRHVQNGNG